MKNIFYLLFVLPLFFSCGDDEDSEGKVTEKPQEFHCMKFRDFDEEYYKESTIKGYDYLILGNALDPFSVSLYYGDEGGGNYVPGGVCEGKYKIEGGYVIFKWPNGGMNVYSTDDLPKKLQINNGGFQSNRVNENVKNVGDFELYQKWNVKNGRSDYK